MESLTESMRQLVDGQGLGLVASVRPDGTPHLAAEDTLAVWNDATLVFADIASVQTRRNLLANPAIEVQVVDPQSREGYRFRGQARLLLSGPTFDRLLDFYRGRGVMQAVQHMVLIRVESVEEVRWGRAFEARREDVE